MASAVPTSIVSHAKRVCSLYKKSIRNLEAYYDRRHIFRYHACMMRARFDENKDIKDMRVANQLLLDGEHELFQNQHYQPKRFAESPGGCAFDREVIPPDWVLDYWHPLEKAQYPDFFAKREQRKLEYLAWWEKQYGKPTAADHHH